MMIILFTTAGGISLLFCRGVSVYIDQPIEKIAERHSGYEKYWLEKDRKYFVL